jgi:hypothetical protein
VGQDAGPVSPTNRGHLIPKWAEASPSHRAKLRRVEKGGTPIEQPTASFPSTPGLPPDGQPSKKIPCPPLHRKSSRPHTAGLNHGNGAASRHCATLMPPGQPIRLQRPPDAPTRPQSHVARRGHSNGADCRRKLKRHARLPRKTSAGAAVNSGSSDRDELQDWLTVSSAVLLLLILLDASLRADGFVTPCSSGASGRT